MQEKIIFREMLSEVKALADSKGNSLTVGEIKEFFANAHLEEDQLKLIYEYLIGQKIKVIGYEAKAGQEEMEAAPEETAKSAEQSIKEAARQEDEFIRMYLEDLEAIAPATEEEETRLFKDAAGGDAAAKSRLVELHLRTVYETANNFRNSILPKSDLIQEGNVGLMLAMDDLSPLKSLEAYRDYVHQAILNSMEEAVTEQKDLKDLEKEIAERVNFLSEAVHNLERDLEHKVSLEELSVYLEMPVEEIKDILRMAGDEIEIAGAEHHHHHEE